ncbi:MAG: glycosyltransferase family 4 protein [Bacteroidales bacterium]|nr:glycosyltransferase family 4 protein [Bacteroidales bacterium]
MKIGIEGQRLFRKKKHGMDMVALELINNLQKIDNKNEYVIFVKPDVDRDCMHETANFKIVELSGNSFPIWEQFLLPRAARKEGCDILHCTSNTAPINTKIPLIITLHDIIYLESISILKKGGTNYQKVGNMYRRFVVPKNVKKSKRIITVSHFEKDRIRNFFGYPENDKKLVAVYNGVSEYFKVVDDKEELDRVKKLYYLPDEFLFFLGNTDPKKNTPGTLKAYSEFIKNSDKKIPLLMLDFGSDYLNKLLEDIGDPELRKHIQLTGYIKNTDLPAIYNLCTVFLYPSLRESFGIPPLEAMRCGAPVISSNTSSMPEIAGGAAHIVDPFNPSEIAKGIEKIISDDNYRKSLVEKGLIQSAKFSWKKMAENVLELYQEIYNMTNNK